MVGLFSGLIRIVHIVLWIDGFCSVIWPSSKEGGFSRAAFFISSTYPPPTFFLRVFAKYSFH